MPDSELRGRSPMDDDVSPTTTRAAKQRLLYVRTVSTVGTCIGRCIQAPNVLVLTVPCVALRRWVVVECCRLNGGNEVGWHLIHSGGQRIGWMAEQQLRRHRWLTKFESLHLVRSGKPVWARWLIRSLCLNIELMFSRETWFMCQRRSSETWQTASASWYIPSATPSSRCSIHENAGFAPCHAFSQPGRELRYADHQHFTKPERRHPPFSSATHMLPTHFRTPISLLLAVSLLA
ncbi:hypothetical protein V8C44DRAFT_333108 [Trichoderma aethiopicum]